MFNISNIKISIKISSIYTDDLIKSIEKNLISYKVTSKYIIVRSDFTYIISKTRNNTLNHINITKIKNFDEIQLSIHHLQSNVLKELDFKINHLSIDNISASYDLKHFVDLRQICENNPQKVRYNNEKFPGLFLRLEKSTLLIFHTGKVNSVGCKTLKDLIEAFSKLIKLF